jgi:hypothetical protein
LQPVKAKNGDQVSKETKGGKILKVKREENTEIKISKETEKIIW